MSLPGRLISVDGVRVFVHRAGTPSPTRPPVVLVHGWLMSHFSFRGVIPLLVAAGHDVIAPDLPGYGESDRPAPAAYRYEPTSFSDTLIGVLDVLGIPRVSLVGASLGGAVALMTAARHPERVARLGLVDPLVYPPRTPGPAALLELPYAGRMLFRAGATRSLIGYVLRRDIFRDASVVSDELVEYVWEHVNRPGGVEAAHDTLRCTRDPSIVQRSTRAVRAPTLIVWGEDDRLFPSHLARRLADEMPGAEVRIIPACGHAPAQERPAELCDALLPWLDAVPASSIARVSA